MIRIDVSQIGKAEIDNLSRTLCGAVKRFYEDPENLKAFEEWKKCKEEQRA